MEIKLLGPVQVDVGSEPLHIHGQRERTLLAALSLRGPATVSRDQLIDALWDGEHPPRSVGNALQATVSRLRRQLDPVAPSAVVLRRDAGYTCLVPSEQVDARRFELLVRQASDEHAGKAAGLLEDALTLWRGEALADADAHGWLREEVDRLTEVRVSAVEDRMAALTALGGGVELVADLQQLVAQHPLRERLRVLLMTSLYRAGRQAEALTLFEETRRMLAEELGVDPSPELQQVHHAILTQDVALPPTPPQALTLTAPAPAAPLPSRMTSFVGRRKELQELQQLLQQHRLITIIGPGGIGKSSLAVAAAQGQSGSQHVPAWFVDLAAVRDPARVATATMSAVGIRSDGEGASDVDPVDRLVGYLGDRPCLLLLDNCEHLAEATALLAHRLLLGCPGLTVVATTREVLGIPGEVIWGTPPMQLPGDVSSADAAGTQAIDTSDVDISDAVALFLDRAGSADPRFTPGEEDLRLIGEICKRLDGLPLAIELAAARIRALPVAEIAARLHDRFRLLDGGARVALPRHQTLRAAIEWSYDLLTEPEATLLIRLAVFSAPWTLSDAESVCADAGLAATEVLPLVLRLVDRSWIARHGGDRFRLLDTMRSYAAERTDHETRQLLQARHAAHFLELCEALGRAPADRRLHGLVEAAIEDINGAIDWALATGDQQLALRFTGALGWLWATFHVAEGRRRLAEVMTAADSGPSLARGRALQAVAYVESYMPTPVTREQALESVALLEQFGDVSGAARSRIITAFIEMTLGGDLRLTAELTDEAEAVASAFEDRWARALAALMRFRLQLHEGHPMTALRHGRQALARFRALDDPWGVPWTSIWLAGALRTTAQLAQARRLLTPTLASLPTPSYPATIALQELGTVAVLQRDLQEGVGAHRRALDLSTRSGVPILVGFSHAAAAYSTRAAGDPVAAWDHYAAALTVFEELGYHAGAVQARCGLGLTHLQLGEPGSAEDELRAALADAGRIGRVEVQLAAAEGLALQWAADDPHCAARLLGAAAAIRSENGILFGAIETDERAQASREIRRLLGEEDYEAAVGEGSRHRIAVLQRPQQPL